MNTKRDVCCEIKPVEPVLVGTGGISDCGCERMIFKSKVKKVEEETFFKRETTYFGGRDGGLYRVRNGTVKVLFDGVCLSREDVRNKIDVYKAFGIHGETIRKGGG
jgi:hypothetical protein